MVLIDQTESSGNPAIASRKHYMSQFAPVVLKDASLADITYSPRDIANGVATLVNGTGVPIADKRLTVSRSRVAQSGRQKVAFKLTLPVVQDVIVNGVSRPTVVRTAYADCTLTFDEASTVTERVETRAALYALFSSTMGVDVIDNLGTLY